MEPTRARRAKAAVALSTTSPTRPRDTPPRPIRIARSRSRREIREHLRLDPCPNAQQREEREVRVGHRLAVLVDDEPRADPDQTADDAAARPSIRRPRSITSTTAIAPHNATGRTRKPDVDRVPAQLPRGRGRPVGQRRLHDPRSGRWNGGRSSRGPQASRARRSDAAFVCGRDVAAVEEEAELEERRRAGSRNMNVKHEESRRTSSSCFTSSRFTFRRTLPVQRAAPGGGHFVEADLEDALFRAGDGQLAAGAGRGRSRSRRRRRRSRREARRGCSTSVSSTR